MEGCKGVRAETRNTPGHNKRISRTVRRLETSGHLFALPWILLPAGPELLWC